MPSLLAAPEFQAASPEGREGALCCYTAGCIGHVWLAVPLLLRAGLQTTLSCLSDFSLQFSVPAGGFGLSVSLPDP